MYKKVYNFVPNRENGTFLYTKKSNVFKGLQEMFSSIYIIKKIKSK